MGGWRELLHTNALRKVFRVKFSKAPERFKSQNPIFQSHLNEQGKISKENTAAMSAAMPGAQHPGVPTAAPPALGGSARGCNRRRQREPHGSFPYPTNGAALLKASPVPAQHPNEPQGQLGPSEPATAETRPPQRANPKAISSASPGRAGGGSTFLSGYKALYWDCFPVQGARGCARLPEPLVPVIKITLSVRGFCQSSTEAGLCA